MAKINYDFRLFTRPIWRQNLESTWEGIDGKYVEDFKKKGCYLCAVTMLTACMEGSTTLKPIDLIERGVTSMISPEITGWSAVSDEFTLVSYTSNMLYNAVKTLIEDRKPVFIQVPGHAVVAYGFNGDVDVINGVPEYSLVSKSSIRIYDPYRGDYDNDLVGLISRYGNITKVRLPE